MSQDRSGAVVKEEAQVHKYEVAEDGSRRLVEIVRAERLYGPKGEVVAESVNVEVVEGGA